MSPLYIDNTQISPKPHHAPYLKNNGPPTLLKTRLLKPTD